MGSLPVVSSGSLDPDQIWRLGFLVCIFLLHWSKWKTEESNTAPPNKVVFFRLVLWRNSGGDGHPLACRGGVERRQAVSPCSDPGARRRDRLMLQRFVMILPLAGSGGEERKKRSLSLCTSGGWRCGGAGDASYRGEISTAGSPPTSLAEGQRSSVPGALLLQRIVVKLPSSC